jgi:hypothetical protein
MSIFRIATAILVLLAATPVPVMADADSRVRAAHPRLVRLLSLGEQRSATFRELMGRLQASNVIVHFEVAPPGHPIDGGLQFVASTAITRYLRVTLRTDLPANELMALMGHELRHAVEVAESPGIRDEASFRRYYEQRGRPTQRDRMVTYDTRAAVEAGLRVALELRTSQAWRAERPAK